VPVSDRDLEAALGEALEEPVALLARRPHDYRSSQPLEELTIDAAPGRVLFKDLTPSVRSRRGGGLAEPLRELEAYRDLLATGTLDAPRCVAAVSMRGRAWLFLEPVDGVPLWQAEGLDPWLAAARWMARLHATPLPARTGHLLRRDERQLRRTARQARMRLGDRAYGRLAAAADLAVTLLAAAPPVLVHGELYPSNLLVQSESPVRIRPVDWETVGLGAAALDVAALTAGTWAHDEPRHMIRAYLGALRAELHPTPAELDAGRLVTALQWLGRPRTWRPPAAHRQDWLADARRAAERLS
jgi:aminoglycoside phosphotransferase (APT) family kinase protein